MIYLILLVSGISVSVVVFVGMRQAYKQGFADGQMEAIIKHTELALQQWAEQQMQGMRTLKASGDELPGEE